MHLKPEAIANPCIVHRLVGARAVLLENLTHGLELAVERSVKFQAFAR
jgi:hypothetical protein